MGSKTVTILRQGGHEVVNTITGEGVKEAMAGAQVAIDVANSPSFEDKAMLEFFRTEVTFRRNFATPAPVDLRARPTPARRHPVNSPGLSPRIVASAVWVRFREAR